jgi:malonyl-CoA O-methyltransferase
VRRWHSLLAASATPWLHEEAGRRMIERLQWFRRKPQDWTHFCPALSGAEVHASLRQHLGSAVTLVEPEPARRSRADRELAQPWWHWRRWLGRPLLWQEPAAQSQDLVWANMVLHTHIDPAELLKRWHEWLRVDGFVMFSCLGPDTAIELKQLYQARGWPPPTADLTDMHDWGDMLVRCGFAEPVMDMERLTLTFTSAQALLAELRQWGRNVHAQRFARLRGRAWRQGLLEVIEREWPRQPDGRLGLTVELVYGHALKPAARWKADAVSTVAVDDLRRSLRQSKTR